MPILILPPTMALVLAYDTPAQIIVIDSENPETVVWQEVSSSDALEALQHNQLYAVDSDGREFLVESIGYPIGDMALCILVSATFSITTGDSGNG